MPAYVIIEIKVHDTVKFEEYKKKAPPSIAAENIFSFSGTNPGTCRPILPKWIDELKFVPITQCLKVPLGFPIGLLC